MGDEDSTVVRQIRSALKRERYPDDRREPPKVNLMAYLPLVLACLAGVAGYVERGAELKALQSSHAELKEQFVEWNKSISGRVRELEIGR